MLFYALCFVCKVTLDMMWSNVGQMGKVYETAMRHTAGIQRHGAWPYLLYVMSDGGQTGCYVVRFSFLAFSMALSMDLRYSRFSFVAPRLHTSLRCLS